MNIEVLANNTVKITLDTIDMTDYDVKYESLSQKSPDTKRLLVELLSLVRMEKNIDLSTQRLFVEAFPGDDGGCLLYISPLNKKDAAKFNNNKICLDNSITCEVDSIDKLTSLCKQVSGKICYSQYESELYYNGTNYRLILAFNGATNPDDIAGLLGEYGSVIGRGKIIRARTAEYFKNITDKNAVEIILKTLS